MLDDNNIKASDYYVSIMLFVLVFMLRIIGPFILTRKAKRFYYR